jgi:hypothetical protein
VRLIVLRILGVFVDRIRFDLERHNFDAFDFL